MENIGFNLKKTVKDVIMLFKLLALNKGILIEFVMEEDVPEMVSGDPNKVSQIINNLLSNAIKFSENGNVRIDIKKLKENENSYVLEFVISDTGIGMTEETIKKLFKPFIREDGTGTRKYKGAGLGLVITHNLVELMNGSINVESKCGAGSSFFVNMEFQNFDGKRPEEQKESNEISLKKKTLSDILGRKIKALVVDDNKLNLSFMEKALDNLDVSYDMAVNGEEAVEAVLRNEYDLILMDCQMPVMDGYKATTIIRGVKFERNTIPIIALTANFSEEDREKCFRAGMNEYMSKPVNLKELREKMRKVLDKTDGNLSNETDKNVLNAKSENMYVESLNLLVKEVSLSLNNAKKFLNDYISMALDSVKKMEAAYKKTDYEEIKSLAHQVKGVSSNLRLSKLQESFSEIERAAKEKSKSVHKKIIISKTLLNELIQQKNNS